MSPFSLIGLIVTVIMNLIIIPFHHSPFDIISFPSIWCEWKHWSLVLFFIKAFSFWYNQ